MIAKRVACGLWVLWAAAIVSGCGIFGGDAASRPAPRPGVRQPPPVSVPQEYVCAVHNLVRSPDDVIAYWHRGRIYYLCNEECLGEFLADPPAGDR